MISFNYAYWMQNVVPRYKFNLYTRYRTNVMWRKKHTMWLFKYQFVNILSLEIVRYIYTRDTYVYIELKYEWIDYGIVEFLVQG